MVKAWWAATAITSAGYIVFDKMMNTLLKRPMRFFDTIEIGTIMNRYSNDMIILDTFVPRYGQIFLETYFLVGSTFAVLIFVSPFHIVILFVLILSLYRHIRIYMTVAIEIKRMTRAALGPMSSACSEILIGI